MADDHPEFDESLMPAVEPASLADIQLDQRHLDYAQSRWPDASEKMQAYRIRQAIWARIQHAKPHPKDPNRRALGGPQPNSGRKQNRRIGQALVEAGRERIKEVVDAAFAPMAEGNDPMERHKAAMNFAKLEENERKMDITEDEYARKTDEDVRREAALMFVEMIRNGELNVDDIVPPPEAEVVDEDPRQLTA